MRARFLLWLALRFLRAAKWCRLAGLDAMPRATRADMQRKFRVVAHISREWRS